MEQRLRTNVVFNGLGVLDACQITSRAPLGYVNFDIGAFQRGAYEIFLVTIYNGAIRGVLIYEFPLLMT